MRVGRAIGQVSGAVLAIALLGSSATPAAESKEPFGASWLSRPDLESRYSAQFLSTAQKWPDQPSSKPLPPVALDKAPGLGQPAVWWRDLPNNPTVHTTDVPKTWCGMAALDIDIYSADANGEVIYLGVANNADEDTGPIHVNDYFLAAVQVNWKGWRQVKIPLADFRMMRRKAGWRPERPPTCGADPSAGWDHVAGLYLFTKVYDNQPNPASQLAIGQAHLDADAGHPTPLLPLPKSPSTVSTASGVDLQGDLRPFSPSDPAERWWNHSGPEIAADRTISAPLHYQPYFRNERALLGYFPKYEPGDVYFTPSGVPWIFARGNSLEYLVGSTWRRIDLTDPILKLAESLGIKDGVHIANLNVARGPAVFFDRAGDLYVIGELADSSKRSRAAFLLHRPAGEARWESYRLPYGPASFEKFTGCNTAMYDGPPAILVGENGRSDESFRLNLLQIDRKPDGSLTFKDPVLISDDALAPALHSGRANQIVTTGDALYVVYGAAQHGLDPKSAEYLRGIPSYVRRFDRKSRTLSPPILLGYAGRSADDPHNWPSLAIDCEGRLHAVLNGHNAPFAYLHSKEPGDIAAWTEPETVGKATSYLGLLMDRKGVLYGVARDSETSYRFDLVLYRREPGGVWTRTPLLAPFRKFYGIWFHDLTIDPLTGRLFLSYKSQSPHVSLFSDQIEMLLYQRPDFSPQSLLKSAAGRMENNYDGRVGPGSRYFSYLLAEEEAAIMTSSDGGRNWRMAVTADFGR